LPKEPSTLSETDYVHPAAVVTTDSCAAKQRPELPPCLGGGGSGSREGAVVIHQSPQVAIRVGQLLRLSLSTDKPHEAVAALAAIRRTLESAGLDLHQLSQVVEAGLQSPPALDDDTNWRRLARLCLDRNGLLTEKERAFLVVILKYRHDPSQKQQAWLVSIAERIGAR